jgi:hypothetical protein
MERYERLGLVEFLGSLHCGGKSAAFGRDDGCFRQVRRMCGDQILRKMRFR